MFDDSIVMRILDLWQREAGADCCFAPSFPHLKSVLETVFVASIRRKEDKAIQLGVSLLLSAALLDTAESHGSMAVTFHRPLPFTVDTLVSLAPSFDPVTTSLAAIPCAGTPDQLEIAGAIFSHHQGSHRFNATRFAPTPLDILTVSAKQPGQLHLFRGGEMIGSFTPDGFTRPSSTPFTESPLTATLMKQVTSHPEYREIGAAYWFAYLDFLDRLLLESARRGHGGTIIWLPEAILPQATRLLEPRIPLESAPEGARHLATFSRLDCHEQHPDQHPMEQTGGGTAIQVSRSRLIKLAQMLAQLSRVDGALILSDRLRPLSFGSVLTAPTWKGEIVSWRDGEMFPSLSVDLAKFGTRHSSAVNFIGLCHSAVAFVISQDGPVAGLTSKSPEVIYWWPDCLSQLWRV
ncbi:MAG: hypothetical protein HQL82_02170 [Magnetococcales bacterium]|nr:hypothetical protein [Magnetococcales bacterium]